MGEFFRGWKRKVGFMTLMMALALAGGWVRSAFVEDSIEIPTGRHSSISLVSGYSQLLLKVDLHPCSDDTLPIPTWRSVKLWGGIRWYDDLPTVFQWEWNGFALAEVPYQELLDDDWQDYRSTYYFAPYWSITIPLTLVSLWVLLSKPRQSSPKKIPEPITGKGGV